MYDVVLIGNNDFTFFSYNESLLKLASFLRQQGYRVFTLNCNHVLTKAEFVKILYRVVSPQTKVIGISTTMLGCTNERVQWNNPDHEFTGNFDLTLEDMALLDEFSYSWFSTNPRLQAQLTQQGFPLPMVWPMAATLIKKINPNIKIVMGGSMMKIAYWDPIMMERFGAMDYLVKGQGESTMLAILKSIETGQSLSFSGTYHGAKIVDDKLYPYIFHDDAGFVRSAEDDGLAWGAVGQIEISRGCSFRCTYCSYDLVGKKTEDYTRPPSSIRDELLRNYDEFGMTHYTIPDDTMNESVEKMRMFADIVQSLPFETSFYCQGRFDLLQAWPEQIDLMLDANITGFYSGIETMCDAAGRAVGKGLGRRRILNTFDLWQTRTQGRILHDSGWICGLPREMPESMVQTFKWLAAPDCPTNGEVAWLTFSPGTPIRENAEKHGYVISEGRSWTTSQYDVNYMARIFDEGQALLTKARWDHNFTWEKQHIYNYDRDFVDQILRYRHRPHAEIPHGFKDWVRQQQRQRLAQYIQTRLNPG